MLGEPFEREQVAGPVVELVLDLDGDDRTAVSPVHSPQLLPEGREPPPYGLQIGGVVGARCAVTGEHPVGQSAVAHLGVAPGADTGDEAEAVAAAQLGETPQIAVPVEPDTALGLLVVDPDRVGGDDGDPAGLHLQEFLLPVPCRAAGEVELAGYGEPGAAAAGEVPARHLDGVGGLPRVTERQVARQRGGGRGRQSQVVSHQEISDSMGGPAVPVAEPAALGPGGHSEQARCYR